MREVLCGVLAVLFVALPAEAETVAVSFSGSVTTGFGMISTGSTYQGSFTYDNTVPETPGSPSGAWYDAISSLKITFDNGAGGIFTYTSPAGRILVENDSGIPPKDNIGFSNVPVGVLSGPSMGGQTPDALFLILVGGDAGLWPSLNLASLPTHYSLSDFATDLLNMGFSGGGTVLGRLRTFNAIPEPATWTMLAAAAAVVWRRRRRASGP